MPYAEHLKQGGDLFAVTLVPEHASQTVWAYVSDLPELTHDTFSLRRLHQELQELEAACWRDGVVGWYCGSDPQNTVFIRWLEGVGASRFTEQDGEVFYRKLITAQPAPQTLKQLARHIRVKREVSV